MDDPRHICMNESCCRSSKYRCGSRANRAASKYLEQTELQAKLLDCFLWSNKSNINEWVMLPIWNASRYNARMSHISRSMSRCHNNSLKSQRVTTLQHSLQHTATRCNGPRHTRVTSQISPISATLRRLQDWLQLEEVRVQHVLQHEEICLQHELEEIHLQHALQLEEIFLQRALQLAEIGLQHELQLAEIGLQHELQLEEIHPQYELQLEEILLQHELQLEEIGLQHELQLAEIGLQHELHLEEILPESSRPRLSQVLCCDSFYWLCDVTCGVICFVDYVWHDSLTMCDMTHFHDYMRNSVWLVLLTVWRDLRCDLFSWLCATWLIYMTVCHIHMCVVTRDSWPVTHVWRKLLQCVAMCCSIVAVTRFNGWRDGMWELTCSCVTWIVAVCCSVLQ